MRNHSDEKSSTLKYLRAARYAGFENATAHYAEEVRKALMKSYMKLDARRESNIRKIIDAIQRRNSKES